MDKSVKRGFSLFLAVLMLSVMCIVPAKAYETNMEGRYFLSTALNKNMALDVFNCGLDNGTNIQIWESNWSEAQDFTVKHVVDEWYVIKHTASGKFLDVEGGSSESGTNVLLWKYDINPEYFYYSQLWRFIKKSGGYAIQNGLGTYLDVCGAKTASGTNVWAYEGNSGKAQLWNLTSVYTNEIRLSSDNITIMRGYSQRVTAYFHGADLHLDELAYNPYSSAYDKDYVTISDENLNQRGTGYTTGSFDLVIYGKKSTWSAGRIANGNRNQHYARYYVGIPDSSGAFNGCFKDFNVTVI